MSIVKSPRPALLRDQVQLVKRKDSSRYEISPIQISFEKGFFVVIRACRLLAQKNEGILLVGVAGPSGAGKTVFTDKVLHFMPSIAVITMDNYSDATRIVEGNFDDPRLTDYDTLLDNIRGLKEGRPVEVPIYDFKSSSRIGYRKVDVPSSRIVIIEGIYALSEKLRPLLDLRVSVTGGFHFDLVNRALSGQEPEEIIHQISQTAYPMYKAFIEPDLETAHIKIINKFNPFTEFQNPSYILKSNKTVTLEHMKEVLSPEHEERREETYDIYLLPPGEDPEACQSYLRMRNRDGKYNLMFEEWVSDSPFIISPRITFEVSERLLGGLMALGYTIAAILKRSSHVFLDEKVCVKTDWLEKLNRTYVQVQGRDRLYVKGIAEQLGLDGTYVPRTYIEQIQLEKAVNDIMALPDDLKTKLSIDDDLVSSPKEALSRAAAARWSKYLHRRLDGRTPDSPAPVAKLSTHVNVAAKAEMHTQKIPLKTIKDCTQDFDGKNVIGKGGYGKVYKGILTWADHVNKPVAIKRVDVTGFQGNKEFNTEVTMLSQYQHENIITLIGFCDDNKEMILVYEYASHGSLDAYLRDTSDTSLSWRQLLEICIGVASALDYLHNHVAEKHRIIHRDIKSANVLLDENWNAKLSDFGLARIGLANQENTFVITNIAGTHGYNDPQYERTGFLTKESDVYSFGVVLFEVLCGRLACDFGYHDERRFLHHLARTRYKNGMLEEIIDRRIRKDIKERSLTKFSAIAYQCLQKTREERPTITEVVFQLKEARKIQLER